MAATEQLLLICRAPTDGEYGDAVRARLHGIDFALRVRMHGAHVVGELTTSAPRALDGSVDVAFQLHVLNAKGNRVRMDTDVTGGGRAELHGDPVQVRALNLARDIRARADLVATGSAMISCTLGVGGARAIGERLLQRVCRARGADSPDPVCALAQLADALEVTEQIVGERDARRQAEREAAARAAAERAAAERAAAERAAAERAAAERAAAERAAAMHAAMCAADERVGEARTAAMRADERVAGARTTATRAANECAADRAVVDRAMVDRAIQRAVDGGRAALERIAAHNATERAAEHVAERIATARNTAERENAARARAQFDAAAADAMRLHELIARPDAAEAPSQRADTAQSAAALCFICTERERNCVLMPCRHMLCAQCAARLGSAARCPYCRTAIASTVVGHV